MIKYINDTLELEKIIGEVLEQQSDLPSERVLNAISVRGQNLSKLIEKDVYISYDLSDLIIIFEVIFNPNSTDNVSMEEEDEIITVYSAFYVKILIYGNKSANVANKLKGRLLSRKVRDDLHTKGIHIERVSNSENMTEILNETFWVRNDLTMEISCRQSFNQKEPDYLMNNLHGLIFKETEE